MPAFESPEEDEEEEDDGQQTNYEPQARRVQFQQQPQHQQPLISSQLDALLHTPPTPVTPVVPAIPTPASPPTLPAPSVQAPYSLSPEDLLASDRSVHTEQPVGVPDLVPVKSKPTEQSLMQLFRLLCVVSDGVLYEDAILQIGLKSEYKQGVGRVMLYYGNTSNSPITQFNTIIAPVNCTFCCCMRRRAYLSMSLSLSLSLCVCADLTIQVQQNPPQIGPLKQESQLINVACVHEFQDALSMQVSYLYAFSLTLTSTLLAHT